MLANYSMNLTAVIRVYDSGGSVFETHNQARQFKWAEGFMSISRNEALAVFHQRYPPGTVHWVETSDTLPAGCTVYNLPDKLLFAARQRQRRRRMSEHQL